MILREIDMYILSCAIRFWEAFSNRAWEGFQLPFPVSQLPRESASHQLKTKTTLEEEN